jgi:two-component system CheB/CheR fusion protein
MAEAMGVDACCRLVKIYATDVDEDDLEKARQGSYTEDIKDLPKNLREKYFDLSTNNDRSVFRQDLRRVLIFGRHDLMHDAPISRLDLLVCRNTLIYFNREAQERIVARFHFALKETGYLFLGQAETMLTFGQLFEPVEIKHRIFRKASVVEARERVETLLRAGQDLQTEGDDDGSQLHQAAFEVAPMARVVIDHRGRLALANDQARSRLGLDLRDVGRPFSDLELSYRPLELRSLIEQAREENQPIVVQDVEWGVPGDDDQIYLDVTLSPLWDSDNNWFGASITFQDVSERQELKYELEQLRYDLETVNEELQSANEELETSNEELQSTVEELQTTNEELQSSNEEMETMNEELQSANAELQALNDQLHNRTRDLNRVNAFLESILASVDVGIVVIDRQFTITLWNERAEDLWGLRAEEVQGQSLLELDIGLPVQELEKPVKRFLAAENGEKEKIELNATNRRGQIIKCNVTRTIRRDPDGEPEGVVLLMEEERE